MFFVKWVSIAAFFIMVGAGIWHFAGEVGTASRVCYVTAGIFACGTFYATTLHRIFPKSGMGDRVADILEKTVEARQVALMHHIQHNHQADLAAMRKLQLAPHAGKKLESEEEDILTIRGGVWNVSSGGGK